MCLKNAGTQANSTPGTSERFEQPKVLIRDTGGGLMGTFDGDEYYLKDVLIVTHTSKSASLLKKLIGVLNSKLLRFFYNTSFPTLHVQRNELASLPIKQELLKTVLAKQCRRWLTASLPPSGRIQRPTRARWSGR